MSRFVRMILFVLFVLVMPVLAGCGGPGAQTVTVNMREFSFSPDAIEVTAGAEVTVNLVNLGALEHNFHVMALGSEVAEAWAETDEANAIVTAGLLEGGGDTSITFTAPNEPGEYQFLCSVPAHLQQGMAGTMIVKP